MKKFAIIPLLPVFIAIGVALISTGCASKDSCPSGQTQLPAKWVEANFPLIEGASICTYNEGKEANLKYKSIETFELHDKYAEKFKSEGWEISMMKPDRSFFAVQKNGKQFTLGFLNCSKPFAKCAYADVSIIGDR